MSPERKEDVAVRSRPKASPKPKKSIELETVFLELTSRVEPTWNHPEPDDYVTPLKGNVCIRGDDEDEEITVGIIQSFHVHLEQALEDGVPWLTFSTLTARIWPSIWIEPDRSSYTEWVESTFEPFGSDLLVLDRIRIEPNHRGRGYGLYAAELMIKGFGPNGGLVACVPAPYELLQEQDAMSVAEAVRRSRNERIPEWQPAEAKLRELWSLLGFQQLPGRDVFALSLTLQRPTIQTVIPKYFGRTRSQVRN